MPRESYLDYNATAPLRPEARAAMVEALALCGNPSSVHRPGRKARAVVEAAREAVAALAGARPIEVVFTSGATEANNLCLAGAPFARRLVSAGEHESVLAAGECGLLALTGDGLVDLEQLEGRLAAASEPLLLALMAANNETGVIQPLSAAAGMVHAQGGRLLTDAVQAAGRLPASHWADADFVSLSAHKLGGPKGVGALVLRGDALLAPQLRGGGQERRLRAGTENVAAIAGFGAAAGAVAAKREAEQARTAVLRDRFEAGLRALVPGVRLFGASVPRLANTSCFAIPGRKAETLLIALDLAGVFVSSGSACSSGKVQRSHVLSAMGVEAGLAEGALRVSFGWSSEDGDVTHCLEALGEIVKRPQRAVA